MSQSNEKIPKRWQLAATLNTLGYTADDLILLEDAFEYLYDSGKASHSKPASPEFLANTPAGKQLRQLNAMIRDPQLRVSMGLNDTKAEFVTQMIVALLARPMHLNLDRFIKTLRRKAQESTTGNLKDRLKSNADILAQRRKARVYIPPVRRKRGPVLNQLRRRERGKDGSR